MAAEGLTNEAPTEPQSPAKTEHATSVNTIPGQWLDRVLVAQCAIRPNWPIEDVSEHLLAVVGEVLDDTAVGVCIPRAGAGQIVVRVAPERASNAIDTDPARLFPGLAFELSMPILSHEGSTLHIACDDALRLADGAPAQLLVERVARMLAANIENHRSFERGLVDLKAQVLHSEKLASIGQIAAGIVHELNNPLTTIIALSDFLQKRARQRGTEPSDVERLARINEAAERILRFSRDLTDYSRPSKEVPAAVAIHDVIERALGFCEHELEKTGVVVERQFRDVELVRGVAGQLTQVFVNLFTNAAHAMRGHGGMLCVGTAMGADDQVKVTVTDDGHGIDADAMPRIFEPFFTTKTDGTGTGLGLSIVRSIINNHGGTIRVDSNSPQGTVFHVDLPVAPDPHGRRLM